MTKQPLVYSVVNTLISRKYKTPYDNPLVICRCKYVMETWLGCQVRGPTKEMLSYLGIINVWT